jgi:hypothetical protein
MSKRRADDMDVDEGDGAMGKRARKPTERGAEYAAAQAAKAARAQARKEKLKANIQAKPRGFPGLGDLLAELDAINIEAPEADSQMDALAARLGSMGGRRRKTVKRKGKGSRKTRKH